MSPVFITHPGGPETPTGFERMSIDAQILLGDPVPEIRVVGVLERLSHTEVEPVLGNWYKWLAPGAALRISVPDFEQIATDYMAGREVPVDREIMGSHATEEDCYGSAYDWTRLAGMMRRAGFVRLGWWQDEAPDGERKLNMEAYKPATALPTVQAVLSIPRLGWNDFWGCAMSALYPLGITISTITGAYWEQCIERAATEALKVNPEYLLFMDYDTIFEQRHIVDLLNLAVAHPECDALAPLQSHRYQPSSLMTIADEEGNVLTRMEREKMMAEVIEANTAHFGLTLIKAEAFQNLPRPWFRSEPNVDGMWEEGKVDADIKFWHQFKAAGRHLYIANRVAVGHLENMIRWPDGELKARYQHPNDFKISGPPNIVWR